MGTARQEELIARLRTMLTPGVAVADGCRVVDVLAARDEAVLLVRWDRDPRLYGIPIALTDTRHEFYYTDYEVASDQEWLDSVGIGLMVMLDTGHRATARRRRVDEHIELRAEDGWPVDQRFYIQDGQHDPELVAESISEHGLDPTLALKRRAEGRLVAWLLAHENNSTGSPWVGHAVVSHGTEDSAVLDAVETSPGVPPSVALDLAYFACQAAAERGALTVTTALADPVFSLAGFREGERGVRVLDTDFLDADPEGARALVEHDLATGGSWSADRDSGKLSLPSTRVGRFVHRLRRGRSGRRSPVRAG